MKRAVRLIHVVLTAALLLTGVAGSASALSVVTRTAPVLPLAVKSPGAPEPTAPEPTREILIFLEPGTDAEAYAQEHSLVLKRRLVSDPDACVFEAASVEAAGRLADAAPGDARVRSAHLNQQLPVQQTAFVPNDPYFPKDAPSAGFLGQWHLVNQHVAGRDIHVQGAWNRDLTGSGVTIGFVDDGLETTHEDLSANYVAADSYDFGSGDSDPSPGTGDDHGTAVAGLAAARGGNATGVTGVAPYSGIAMMRVDFDCSSVAQFVDATLYHSSGTNTNVKVKSHSYGFINPWVNSAAEMNALAVSSDCGTIHVWAAGNQGSDANKRGLVNHPAAIVVTALSSDDNYASYGNFGANIFCSAYTHSDDTPTQFDGITTTDRTGASGYNPPDPLTDRNYTTTFGGTSACAPIVAGIMALGKQVQPNLDTRFAKHLLALTCDKVDPADATYTSDGGWRTNAAGYEFNQNYGFGRVNADAFTQAAMQYVGVTPGTLESFSADVDFDIPDGDPSTIWGFLFDMNSTQALEEVLLSVDVTHSWRGDLEFYVLSPQGTLGRMSIYSGSDGGDNILWTFTSNLFWGEDPEGEWGVYVRDVFAGDAGTWNWFSLQLLTGELIPVPEPGTWALMGTGTLLILGIVARRRMRDR